MSKSKHYYESLRDKISELTIMNEGLSKNLQETKEKLEKSRQVLYMAALLDKSGLCKQTADDTK